MSLTLEIKLYAYGLGFDLVATAPISAPPHGDALARWLEAGYYGEMGYLARRATERLSPALLAPDARSAIVLGMRHQSDPIPAAWADPSYGRVARYAWAPDYHDTLKPKLYALDRFIRARTGRAAPGRVCVDTAPFMERGAAAQAGLGFIGRNTCLIAPGLGSWLHLAALLVPETLESDAAAGARMAVGKDEQVTTDRSPDDDWSGTPWTAPRDSSDPRKDLRTASAWTCGRCTRCLEACPTGALVAPYVLDARRCISYLTIELKGAIPAPLRPRLGNRVFGCDACQDVCPYNRGRIHAGLRWPHRGQLSAAESAAGREPPLRASPEQLRQIMGTGLPDVRLAQPSADHVESAPALLTLLALSEGSFRLQYRHTPLERAKRRGLVRNACVAAGNWGDPLAVPALVTLLGDPEPLVRGHAAWALGKCATAEARAALVVAAGAESEAWVTDEIAAAIASQT